MARRCPHIGRRGVSWRKDQGASYTAYESEDYIESVRVPPSRNIEDGLVTLKGWDQVRVISLVLLTDDPKRIQLCRLPLGAGWQHARRNAVAEHYTHSQGR